MGKLTPSPFPVGCNSQVALLDTNILLLRVSARTNPSLLKTFKRINQFSFEDVVLLEWILGNFSRFITTAYVLAEASNLGNSLSGAMRNAWFLELASYAVVTEERHVATSILGTKPETIRFGMTDSALAHLAESVVVITTEHPLTGYLQSRGLNVLNFFDVKTVARNRFR